MAAGLAVDELRPWHFVDHAGGFEWVPFASMLELTWTTALPILFRKAAVYGTAVWAIARAGIGITGSAVLVAALLACLLGAQIFLPGRTAETTDPVLALVLGLILLRLDHKHGAHPGRGTPLSRRRAAPSPASDPWPALLRPPSHSPAPGRKIWTGGRRSDF